MVGSAWIVYALGAAFFAALTALFGKLGVAEINSNLATFIRTVIIVLLTAAIVTWRQEWQPLDRLSRHSIALLVLSAIATGLSWLCYYRALQIGPASGVATVDKLSVVLVIIFSVLFLGEALTWKLALGAFLIFAGAVLVAMP